MADVFTPYSTAKPYFAGSLPQWMLPEDAERIMSYDVYEKMYWSESNEGVIIEDGEPINLPVGKALVEAVHRFLAVGWDFKIVGNDPDQRCRIAFTNLFKREQVKSKVSTAKRYGLIRGDAMLHVVADPLKSAGSRISIYELDPSTYFPIYDIDEPDRILGCHIVDQILDAQDKLIIRRQTYRKQEDEDTGEFTGVITTELALFETEGWDDRFGRKPEDIKRIQTITPETPLPAPISAIPVYHWKNTRNPVDMFGSSLLRGIEKVLKSIDQVITDEDVALALASLGVYATDSAPPGTDPNDPTKEADGSWVIGPGRVIEVQRGTSFTRVPGITSVQPALDHATYLEAKARSGASVPAVAMGDVDVPSAESGIALMLKFMPLLAANAERELEILSVLDHMLYDLQTMWFPAYEGLNFGAELLVESVTKDAMPVNRQAVIDETLALLSDGVITLGMAVAKLQSLGWEFTSEDIAELVAAKKAAAAATADPFGERVAAEKETDSEDADA